MKEKIKKMFKIAFKFIHKYYSLILIILLFVTYIITGQMYIIIPLVLMPILLIIDYHWTLKRKEKQIEKTCKLNIELNNENIKINNHLNDELEKIKDIRLYLSKLAAAISEEE